MDARARAVAFAVLLSAGVPLARAAGVVTVSQPWARPAALHASTPVYLELGSSDDVTLVAVRSSLGNVALMRGNARVHDIGLAAHVPLPMAAAREHLVLERVSRRLVTGDRVPLTLVLRDAQGATREIDVSAEVRPRSPIDDERRAHGRH